MAKRGRKNRYETHVVPFFPQINEWLANGATEKQIAEIGLFNMRKDRFGHNGFSGRNTKRH